MPPANVIKPPQGLGLGEEIVTAVQELDAKAAQLLRPILSLKENKQFSGRRLMYIPFLLGCCAVAHFLGKNWTLLLPKKNPSPKLTHLKALSTLVEFSPGTITQFYVFIEPWANHPGQLLVLSYPGIFKATSAMDAGRTQGCSEWQVFTPYVDTAPTCALLTPQVPRPWGRTKICLIAFTYSLPPLVSSPVTWTSTFTTQCFTDEKEKSLECLESTMLDPEWVLDKIFSYTSLP